ncbi:MAG: hypothetical protein M3415_01945, partial [Actinomycetota bacterium]|nr:hypothetical protein [Actinomycetota bacterium]
HRLADRPALISDLAAAPPFDVLLVELKAAAIDVAVRSAARAGARVVFCDNRPIIVGAHEATGDATGLQDAVVALTRLADERATAR